MLPVVKTAIITKLKNPKYNLKSAILPTENSLQKAKLDIKSSSFRPVSPTNCLQKFTNRS
jgi:hypothetical protein